MSVTVQGKQYPNGPEMPISLDRFGNMVNKTSFAAAVERGRMYATTNQGTGIVTQAGLSATDAILSLHNPAGSGIVGRLWYAGFLSKVAAAAAAVVWLAANTNVAAAIPTGTAAVVRNLKLGGGMTNTQGQKLEALTTTTLPVAPVAICTLGCLLTGAITVATAIPMLERWFNGGLLIMPGTTLSFQTSTASGAAACHGEFYWEEEDQA